MNSRSPVNTTPASGTCTIESLPVWAGPNSMNTTSRSPTPSSSRPSQVEDGSRSSQPSQSNGPKFSRAKEVNTGSPWSPLNRKLTSSGGAAFISSTAAEVP